MNNNNTSTNIYYDTVAENYDAMFVDSLSVAENNIVKKDLEKIVKTKLSVEVLDIGCGTGLAYELLLDIAAKTGVAIHYTGIDIAEKMIDKAKEKHGGSATFLVADMDNLPPEVLNKKFDLILSLFGSFSHTREYEEILNNLINDLLKPNGDMYLMVYSRYSLKNIYHAISTWNFDYLKFRRGYNIRNCGVSITCPAFFFSPSKMLKAIRNRKTLKVNFSSINALFEIPFFKKMLYHLPSQFVYSILTLERLALTILPILGHSLICQIKKV